jgi:hypothetical protein
LILSVAFGARLIDDRAATRLLGVDRQGELSAGTGEICYDMARLPAVRGAVSSTYK